MARPTGVWRHESLQHSISPPSVLNIIEDDLANPAPCIGLHDVGIAASIERRHHQTTRNDRARTAQNRRARPGCCSADRQARTGSGGFVRRRYLSVFPKIAICRSTPALSNEVEMVSDSASGLREKLEEIRFAPSTVSPIRSVFRSGGCRAASTATAREWRSHRGQCLG